MPHGNQGVALITQGPSAALTGIRVGNTVYADSWLPESVRPPPITTHFINTGNMMTENELDEQIEMERQALTDNPEYEKHPPKYWNIDEWLKQAGVKPLERNHRIIL